MIACGCEVCTSTNKKDKRFRSSILVQSPNTTLVVDTGPDFRCQMLRENVKHLDAVLLTHSHKDHISGLDDIRAFNFFSKKSMDIYADTNTQAAVRNEFYYAFSEKKYPGIPELNLRTLTPEPFIVGDIPVVPVIVWHMKLPVYGFRFGKFTYITDANRIDDSEKDKIRGSEILVLNALRKQTHISHFTLGEAIDMASELKVPTAYFTHLSHQMGLHNEIESELPDGMHLAYDRLQLNIQ